MNKLTTHPEIFKNGMFKFSWKLKKPACRELISRCKFFDPRFCVLSMAKRAPKNILIVIYEYMAKNSRARADKSEKKKNSQERWRQRKLNSAAKFYRCKYSFWFRPCPARITSDYFDTKQLALSGSTLAGRHLADNWIPNSSPELSYIFFRDAVEILCALRVPGRYYSNIRKSVRACYVRKSRAKPFVDTCVSPTVSCIGCF